MRVDLPACNFENCRFNLDFNCINKRQFKECILKDLLNIKNIYKVDREEPIHYCEDYSMIVVAEDEEEAKIIARRESEDFENARLKVSAINIMESKYILTANSGA